MFSSLSFIGFMGSGKTSVGKKVSSFLNIPFLDLDEYIERKIKKNITEIFQEKGEEYFRDIETKFLKEVFSLYQNIILSTGGGIVLKEENRKILKENSRVIYLKGEFENLMKHLEDKEEYEKRPLLRKRKEELFKLWENRLPLYESCADMIIAIDNKSIDEIVYEILEGLKDD